MADIDLSGKTAIVTGGGRGMGRSMAFALVEAGACVTITAVREGFELEATANARLSVPWKESDRTSIRSGIEGIIDGVRKDGLASKLKSGFSPSTESLWPH